MNELPKLNPSIHEVRMKWTDEGEIDLAQRLHAEVRTFKICSLKNKGQTPLLRDGSRKC